MMHGFVTMGVRIRRNNFCDSLINHQISGLRSAVRKVDLCGCCIKLHVLDVCHCHIHGYARLTNEYVYLQILINVF